MFVLFRVSLKGKGGRCNAFAETNNDLSATGYDHVDVIRELAPPDIELLRDIQQITPGGHPADCTMTLAIWSTIGNAIES